MPPKTETFLSDMPSWVKVLVQLGFAGLIGLLFALDSRDRSSQLREMQVETRNQARDDRIMFREEMRSQRESLNAAVAEMRNAVQAISHQQLQLKKDVDDIKNPFPSPHPKP